MFAYLHRKKKIDVSTWSVYVRTRISGSSTTVQRYNTTTKYNQGRTQVNYKQMSARRYRCIIIRTVNTQRKIAIRMHGQTSPWSIVIRTYVQSLRSFPTDWEGGISMIQVTPSALQVHLLRTIHMRLYGHRQTRTRSQQTMVPPQV